MQYDQYIQVLLDRSFNAYIGDFGIARKSGSTETKHVVGTYQ